MTSDPKLEQAITDVFTAATAIEYYRGKQVQFGTLSNEDVIFRSAAERRGWEARQALREMFSSK